MVKVFTVSEINSYIKGMFDTDPVLIRVSISGEVSNCKYHSSGHIYFTLKDSNSNISVAMWASRKPTGLKFILKDGQQVKVDGSISTYEKTGQYQLYAHNITEEGSGALYERYLKLKDKLEKEGLFDKSHKKEIPKYARRIGIVTASTGAAIQDIINISHRRDPSIQLILYPAIVQGIEAPDSIIKGIKSLDNHDVDIIIVGRGGGSIEDLWGFNDEKVARAVYEAKTPIISAVGHEIDYTIIDFVADLRAPTPSAAAELATMDMDSFIRSLESYRDILNDNIANAISLARDDLIRYKEDLYDIVHDNIIKLHNRSMKYQMNIIKYSPRNKLQQYITQLSSYKSDINNNMSIIMMKYKNRLTKMVSLMQGLSPLNRLSSGYAFVTDDKGKKISSVADIKLDSIVDMRWEDGSARAKVMEVKNGNKEI